MYRIVFHEVEDGPGEVLRDEINYITTAFPEAGSYALHEIESAHQRVVLESYMEAYEDMPGVGDGITIASFQKVHGRVVTVIELMSIDVLS